MKFSFLKKKKIKKNKRKIYYKIIKIIKVKAQKIYDFYQILIKHKY